MFVGSTLYRIECASLPGQIEIRDGRIDGDTITFDGTLFLGTLDAHLVAIDAYTGKRLWNATVDDFRDPLCQGRFACHSITLAPLIVRDKVIVGTGGGDSD